MTLFMLVALAGAAGAVARFLVDRAVTRAVPNGKALGTFAVNISGCLLLGLVLGTLAGGGDSQATIVIGTGFLGAYTTFSTWMIQSLRLLQHGAWRAAAFNLLLPAALGPPAALIGLAIGSTI